MAVSLSGFMQFYGWSGTRRRVLNSEGERVLEPIPADFARESLLGSSKKPADNLIKSFLNVSSAIIKDMLGFTDSENLPDNDRVDNSIYLLTQFYLENRSSQEKTENIMIDDNFISEKKMSYYRQQVYPALLKQITGMIVKYRKHTKFIPDLSTVRTT